MALEYLAGKLKDAEQAALLAALRAVIEEAPLFTPTMPRSGKKMSVRMTNCGPLGWVTPYSSTTLNVAPSVMETPLTVSVAWPVTVIVTGFELGAAVDGTTLQVTPGWFVSILTTSDPVVSVFPALSILQKVIVCEPLPETPKTVV